MSTVRHLFPEMDQTPLTRRDAWSSHFEYLFEELDEPRVDCPMHTVEPLTPTASLTSRQSPNQLEAPLIDIQLDIARVHAHLTGTEMPEFKNQREHSIWLTKQFQKHKQVTKHYNKFKSNGGVLKDHIKEQVTAYKAKMFVKNAPKELDPPEFAWNINGIPHGCLTPLYILLD